VARIAESQANAWDAIGALAKEYANLAKGHVELSEGLSRLELLIERYIAAKSNGHNGADQWASDERSGTPWYVSFSGSWSCPFRQAWRAPLRTIPNGVPNELRQTEVSLQGKRCLSRAVGNSLVYLLKLWPVGGRKYEQTGNVVKNQYGASGLCSPNGQEL
jgi:hypothetical protein